MTWFLFVLVLIPAGFEVVAEPSASGWTCQRAAETIEQAVPSAWAWCEPRGRV